MKCPAAECEGTVHVYVVQKLKYDVDDKGTIVPIKMEADKDGNPVSLQDPSRVELISMDAICDTCETKFKVNQSIEEA